MERISLADVIGQWWGVEGTVMNLRGTQNDDESVECLCDPLLLKKHSYFMEIVAVTHGKQPLSEPAWII